VGTVSAPDFYPLLSLSLVVLGLAALAAVAGDIEEAARVGDAARVEKLSVDLPACTDASLTALQRFLD